MAMMAWDFKARCWKAQKVLCSVPQFLPLGEPVAVQRGNGLSWELITTFSHWEEPRWAWSCRPSRAFRYSSLHHTMMATARDTPLLSPRWMLSNSSPIATLRNGGYWNFPWLGHEMPSIDSCVWMFPDWWSLEKIVKVVGWKVLLTGVGHWGRPLKVAPQCAF